MTNHVDRFHAALLVLAGHGHIKQRLTKAYEDNLVETHEDELPLAMQQAFADLRQEMHSVAPLNGEGPIRASVRKMSYEQASLCAATILTLYGDLIRMQGDADVPLAVNDGDEARVPPFLVKTN